MVTDKDGSPEDDLLLDDRALLARCHVDTYRSHGPGGQKRNKTDSAVRLRHRSTGLIVTATEDRSQHVNKTRAVRRLREAIALHVRTGLDLQRYSPSALLRACVTGCGGDRWQMPACWPSRRDPRYYLVVRELLDLLVACDLRVAEAGSRLGTSTSLVVKVIQSDAKLWERVNQLRAAAGVKPLR